MTLKPPHAGQRHTCYKTVGDSCKYTECNFVIHSFVSGFLFFLDVWGFERPDLISQITVASLIVGVNMCNQMVCTLPLMA